MRPFTIIDASLAGSDGLQRADLRVSDGLIAAIGPSVAEPDDDRVDADGRVLAPGYIDLQVNGIGGADLTEDPSALAMVAEKLAALGTTSFLPTLISPDAATIEAARRSLRAMRDRRRPGTAEALGLHIEGPMIAPAARGMHPLDRLRTLAPTEHMRLVPPDVAMVTLAPELPGAHAAIDALVAASVVVAMGHSEADDETARNAIGRGASLVTHLFNGMGPFHHRAPGMVGVALTDPRISASLIADGVHVAPAAVDLAWRCLGPDRLILVSDLVGAAGLEPGRHRVAGVSVEVHGPEEGRGPSTVRTEDGSLAGGAASLATAVANLVAFTGAPVHEAIRTVTATPARLVGAHDRGRLEVGCRADLVLLDDDLAPTTVWVNGVADRAAPDR